MLSFSLKLLHLPLPVSLGRPLPYLPPSSSSFPLCFPPTPWLPLPASSSLLASHSDFFLLLSLCFPSIPWLLLPAPFFLCSLCSSHDIVLNAKERHTKKKKKLSRVGTRRVSVTKNKVLALTEFVIQLDWLALNRCEQKPKNKCCRCGEDKGKKTEGEAPLQKVDGWMDRRMNRWTETEVSFHHSNCSKLFILYQNEPISLSRKKEKKEHI